MVSPMTAINSESVIYLYLLATNASARLTTESHRSDQRLSRLVAHTNFIDRLAEEIYAQQNVTNAVRVKPVPKRLSKTIPA